MPRERTPDRNGERQAEPHVRTSRRRFLEATGVAGLIGGVGGFAMAQQEPTTYEFGGEVAGWRARAPSEIEGETNPTLELEVGTEYEVVWENLDGAPHDFTIQDDQGNTLANTETMSEQGATRSLTFTASEEMAQYICTIHPGSMVGDIEITGDGTPAAGTETPQQAGFVPAGPTVGAQLVADGPLVNPVTFRTVPGMQDTHVIVDQMGVIYIHQDGELQEEPFLDLTDRVMILADTQGGFDRPEGFDERGLLGLAFHPDFQENGQFYVRYSSARPRSAGDQLAGPGERGYPEDWDHIAVLSEFQMAGDVGTATENGTATAANATQGGNETDGQTATPAGGGGQLQADPESERVLLEVPEPQFNHNGGEVMFGPDGYLYATLGDGGDGNDTGVGHVEDWYDENEGGNGQDLTRNLLGSVLRIDVDQEGEDRPYAVPDDNPLVDTDGFDEMYAWGLRNPWRASFNDGRLVAGDVGQALFEELDVIERGGNYGWNVREGFHCFNAADATNPLEQCPSSAPGQAPYNGQQLVDPVLEYPHTYEGTSVGISITAGYVYQGDQLSQLSGQYVFGDWSSSFTRPQGRVFVATPDGQGDQAATTEATETGAGTAGNQTAENQTAGNATGTEIGNVSVGQESGDDGNVTNGTAANQTGNETGGAQTETPVPVEEAVDLTQPSEQPWPYQEVRFEGGENGMLNRFIQAFGRDDQGNVYVLASRTGRLTSPAGEVYRLVPAGEGEQITPPPTPTPEAGGAENETGGAETNATAANETAGGNETGGNQTGN